MEPVSAAGTPPPAQDLAEAGEARATERAAAQSRQEALRVSEEETRAAGLTLYQAIYTGKGSIIDTLV
ncbi:MAG: hypothetical protein PHV85_08405 [Desulfovibrionaceae bacterium]|nr:hypothetical protein [Desulfovibrionaceae bacterium]MDD4952555.1 hypothetical protein [Desulfovibrionaceae bacterium]